MATRDQNAAKKDFGDRIAPDAATTYVNSGDDKKDAGVNWLTYTMNPVNADAVGVLEAIRPKLTPIVTHNFQNGTNEDRDSAITHFVSALDPNDTTSEKFGREFAQLVSGQTRQDFLEADKDNKKKHTEKFSKSVANKTWWKSALDNSAITAAVSSVATAAVTVWVMSADPEQTGPEPLTYDQQRIVELTAENTDLKGKVAELEAQSGDSATSSIYMRFDEAGNPDNFAYFPGKFLLEQPGISLEGQEYVTFDEILEIVGNKGLDKSLQIRDIIAGNPEWAGSPILNVQVDERILQSERNRQVFKDHIEVMRADMEAYIAENQGTTGLRYVFSRVPDPAAGADSVMLRIDRLAPGKAPVAIVGGTTEEAPTATPEP